MYELKGNLVMYKTEAMVAAVPYGRVISAFPTGTENQFEIKRFNFETEKYEHTDELTEWEGNAVAGGYFTVMPEPVPEPTEDDLIQAEMLLAQQEILINQQSQDEVLATILLAQQGV